MHEFYKIVDSATNKQQQNLAELTGSAFGSSPKTLCNHIRYLRAGSIGQLFWNESWKQAVTDVADHTNVDWRTVLGDRRWHDLKAEEIESAVVVKVFQNMLTQLTLEQQQQIILEFKRSSDDPHLEGFLLGGGAMATAKISGFGVYLLASTVLGSFTSALGITLPFAIYMGVSQTIALVLGPVGWAALAGGILFTLNQPNWNRLILAVIYISMLRHSDSTEQEQS